MLFSIALPLFSLLSLASADFACDSSSAMSPEQFAAALQQVTSTPSSGTSGSDAGTSCIVYPACPFCQQDPTAELCRNWHQTQLNDMANANLLNGAASFGLLTSRSLSARATSLQCADTDGCVAITTDLLMCIDPNTFNFQDSNGGSGNLGSDTYTMSNGEVTQVASSATALPTPTGSGSGSGSGTIAANAAGATATGIGAASSSGNGDASAALGLKVDPLLGMALLALGAGSALL